MSKDYSRRDILALAGKAAFGLGLMHNSGWSSTSRQRPSLYWIAGEGAGLRSVADVRDFVTTGTTSTAYRSILDAARAAIGADPIIPSTPLEGRNPETIANANPDFYVTTAASQRILQSAFVTVVEDDISLSRPALDQLASLFDDRQWPQWIDQAHVHFGHPVDLRTGMLAEAIGLCYDWLYSYLTPSEREWVVRELDRRAIQPFKTSLGQDPWWLRDKNNWMTTIVGGMGIAGMALRDDHPESSFLVDLALEHMEDYLSIFGPDGEFNESTAYANATIRPVSLFGAHRYWSEGSVNRLAMPPFAEACRWVQYMTLPPGRTAAFGDSHTDRPPRISYVAAVAAASRDSVLQWFFEQHREDSSDPVALLWYDPTLAPVSPSEAGWPLGRAFPAHGSCVVSRTDWSPDAARCVVYGKAGREENHEHNDVGQLCIDAFGERLIVDLGSPPIYPADFFDEARYEYYNASVRGHNVLMFDGEEMRVPVRERGEPIGDQADRLSGRIIRSEFEDRTGGMWTIDCTNAYEGVERVTRTVLFLTPGVVIVYDNARLPRTRRGSLRWHTIAPCSPGADGSFGFQTKRGGLAAQIVPLSGDMIFSSGRHAYREPFNRGRDGGLLEQRHEPYIEIVSETQHFAVVTLFYAGPSSETVGWRREDNRWLLDASDIRAAVMIGDEAIAVADRDDGRRWETGR